MNQATKTRMTFEEYLAYDDGTDKHYEFEGGELVEMPPESPLNSRIARFLFAILLNVFSEDLVCHKDTEISVSGTQVQARLPDLMLLSSKLAEILNSTSRGTITLEMPPPDLIVEVVSPGATNENRDYRFKRSEYAARGVPEYWAIAQTHTAQARALVAQMYRGDKLHIPEFCLLECTNVLWKEVRFHGLSQVNAEQIVQELLRLPFQVEFVSHLLPEALQIGLAYQLAINDSLYITLARYLALPLITVDERQSVAANASGVMIKPISDFSIGQI